MNKLFYISYGVIVITFLVLNIIFSPPRYIIADQAPIEMRTEENETVQALLTWEQDSWNIYQTIHFFPSKRQLCVYSKELDIKWGLDEINNVSIPNPPSIPFTIPTWKYWLGSITLILSVFIIYLIYILESIYNYKIAEKENSFRSYKNYLLKSIIPKFLRKKAGLKLKSKIGTYKEFLKLVTLNTTGELKEVMFQIIDSIAESGNVKVNLKVETNNNLIPQKEFLQKTKKIYEKFLEPSFNNNSLVKWKESLQKEAILKNKQKEVEAFINKIKTIDDFKKASNIIIEGLNKKISYQYTDLSESFSKNKEIDRKHLYANYLEKLFKSIFPEQIITIENDINSLITFHLNRSIDNRETFEFWKEDEGKLLKDITLLPDIKYTWEFYVTIKHIDPSKEDYISSKITSTTSYPLYTKNNVVEDYYMFITMSAFASFTKEITSGFGMLKNSKLKISNGLKPFDLYLTFENKLSDFLMEQSEDIPTSVLEEFYGEYQSSLDGLLIDDEYLDLLYDGLEGAISSAKEVYEGIDFLKETIQNS